LAVSAYGKDAQDAVQRTLKDVEKISFDKMYYRKDIGFDL
jgi:phosphoribosylamine--glycine ligase